MRTTRLQPVTFLSGIALLVLALYIGAVPTTFGHAIVGFRVMVAAFAAGGFLVGWAVALPSFPKLTAFLGTLLLAASLLVLFLTDIVLEVVVMGGIFSLLFFFMAIGSILHLRNFRNN